MVECFCKVNNYVIYRSFSYMMVKYPNPPALVLVDLKDL